jgi:hypothetical protein
VSSSRILKRAFSTRQLLASALISLLTAQPYSSQLAAGGSGGAVSTSHSADTEKQAKQDRRPTEFYSIFNFGYGGDDFPKDAALFEKIVKKVAEEGKFNAILCAHSDEREAICKKHGMKMMVDLLSHQYHVYKSPEQAEALLKKLQGNEVIMGYHLWSDRFGGTGEGRVRDIQNVSTWDPTHPTYSATYKTHGIEYLAQADIFGWYDFHWKRSGWNRHFNALKVALPLAQQHNSIYYSLLSTDSGKAGAGNYNRSLWSANQGIAFGMKGCLWFIGMRQMNKENAEWTAFGKDINKVNAQIMPLKHEIMRIGNPSAVYATPITKDANNRDVANGPTILEELKGNEFPEDFWIQPEAGEFTMGVFKDDLGRNAVYVANFNAYLGQNIKLKLSKPVQARMFKRTEEKWVDLPIVNGVVSFETGPGEGELLRFEGL